MLIYLAREYQQNLSKLQRFISVLCLEFTLERVFSTAQRGENLNKLKFEL